MHNFLKTPIRVVFLSILFMLFPHDIGASRGPFLSSSNREVISRIHSIAVRYSELGTVVNILGNGKIPQYVTQTTQSPPKILVDILCASESLETTKVPLDGPNLIGLRIGYHPQKVRLVLDLKGTDLPDFTAQSVGNELTIAMKTKGAGNFNASRANLIHESDSTKELFDQTANESSPIQPFKRTIETKGQETSESKELQPPLNTEKQPVKEVSELQKVQHSANNEKIADQQASEPDENHKIQTADPLTTVSQPIDTRSDNLGQNATIYDSSKPAKELEAILPSTVQDDYLEIESQGKRYPVRISKEPENLISKKTIYQNSLTQIVPDDGRDDTAFLIESLNAYESQNWSRAIENLTNLIKTNPTGRYAERACFLLAKSYDQLYAQSTAKHFDEIKKYYDDASYKFPSSEYMPEAYLGIGNLFFTIGNDYEAMAYFNLAIKSAEGSSLAAKALIQKINILLRTERKKEALAVSSVLDDVVSRLPDITVKTEAKILRAKLLYEFNLYRNSLDILSEIVKTNPQNIYQYPIISLYLGYNYYQLQDNNNARNNLLRFYNIYPDQEMNDLVLTQIGDTYRNEGRVKDAEKFYQLVLKRYPNKEGTVISKIRLAELQEDRKVDVENNIVPPINILDEDMARAADFYKEIINNPKNKQNETPLTQLALLKLAIISQKENKYQKSLEYLKTLFDKYPHSKLRADAKQTLTQTIDMMFKEEQQSKRYTNIINFYLAEKDLVWEANSPELFLGVARAFVSQNLEDAGTELFKQADLLLADEEKPSDLLFALANDFYNQGRLDSAFKRFGLLINNHPSDKNVPYAYRMKGNILLKQKQYPAATKMFSETLKYPIGSCERLNTLIAKATSLAENKSNDRALEAAKEANFLIRSCSSVGYQVYQELGDLYFNLADIQKSVASYNQAIEMTHDQAEKVSLMLKVAQCYLRLNQKENFLALNERISSLNDPFWSNLAKEKMEEMNFNWEIKKTKAELKNGKKS